MIETLLLVMPLMLSPGPANLVSFAFGARFGLSRILPFLLGVSIVYVFLALALGAGTNHLMGQYSGLTDFKKFFGGAFIVYLGIQLLRRKNRDISTRVPNIWNGITLQILNPKYPPVVLSVFAASREKHAILTAGTLAAVGMAGLLIYAATGAVIHRKVDMERQFGTVDVVFGVLLCLVGFWLLAQPLSG